MVSSVAKDNNNNNSNNNIIYIDNNIIYIAPYWHQRADERHGNPPAR